MKFFLVLLGVFGLIASANAQHEVEGKEAHIPHGPHHLSILLADTRSMARVIIQHSVSTMSIG